MQQFTQALSPTRWIGRKRKQFKQPQNTLSRQFVAPIAQHTSAVLVTWQSPFRNCTMQHWYHEACYMAKRTGYYKQEAQRIAYGDIDGDRWCHVCQQWIEAPESIDTAFLPKVEYNE